jgi:hypothetical protein
VRAGRRERLPLDGDPLDVDRCGRGQGPAAPGAEPAAIPGGLEPLPLLVRGDPEPIGTHPGFLRAFLIMLRQNKYSATHLASARALNLRGQVIGHGTLLRAL